MIGRRDFIAAGGGIAASTILGLIAARGQQRSMPVIGWLSGLTEERGRQLFTSFNHALNETGFVIGRNVAIEYRWAEGRLDQAQALATELVERRVSVLVASAGSNFAAAAKAATATIPIVYVGGGDPVRLGLVASYNRPGGNVTGVRLLNTTESKRLGLLREMVPKAGLIAVLTNPNNVNSESQVTDVEQGAVSVGQRISIFKASTDAEINAAFGAMNEMHVEALLVAPDVFLGNVSDRIIAWATRNSIPMINSVRESAYAGALMSYGPDNDEIYRQAGTYTARILKGEKPSELPVFQTTKFFFAINLKAAKSIGIQVPPTLSALADEIIE